MKITLDRINEAVLLSAKNEVGNEILMDGKEKIGGVGKGASPMEVILMALGGCSTMDVLSILKKMKQELTSYSIEIDGNREEDVIPSLFTDIHVRYLIEGEGLSAERVQRAVDLSMEKYCSVTKILEKSASITYDVLINGTKI